MTEQNQLIWLKRWAEFMEARDWDQLMRRAPVSEIRYVAKPGHMCRFFVFCESHQS